MKKLLLALTAIAVSFNTHAAYGPVSYSRTLLIQSNGNILKTPTIHYSGFNREVTVANVAESLNAYYGTYDDKGKEVLTQLYAIKASPIDTLCGNIPSIEGEESKLVSSHPSEDQRRVDTLSEIDEILIGVFEKQES